MSAPPTVQPRFASPQAYTPKHLAAKILTSRSALEGERKQVTVLFADVKGSMELLADRDPEEAPKLLDPVLERMMEAVHHYEGTVNQVMGDGIMALFGAPLAHEDHAVRACYAALRMQESVKRYAETIQRTVGVPVHIRVGLNSGEVVVRAIGSDLHMDYTAVGQTTHLAARMEQTAMPGSILITADALRLAEGYVQVKALGPVPIKGVTEPIEVYEVTGVGPVRRRLEAATARGLTRFVGRQTELEALRQALEKARTGHGQVVALVGEPGVGKSRLIWEFTHSHRTHGWLVLDSASVSYGKATAYLPVIDLLKGYFGVEDRDEARKIREKITGKLLTLDSALEPTLPALLALLEVPVEDPRWQALDPRHRSQRTRDAVKRLLLRESQVQPLCLIFEDLHWIDSETQAILDSLIESLPTAQLLLLANYRPEYHHAWGSKTYYTQLLIDALPPESAEELLNAILGDDASLQPFKRLLIERTEGNPFFLEESVRALVETQVLVGVRGAYRLTKPLPSIQPPATVQAVLAARIDRLPPEEKRLLQSASAIGKDVPYALLHAIAEEPDQALGQGFAHLQAAEFLYETTLFPELEYTFKHALTHEVAYGSLLQERRRTLHAQIVDALERLYPDRLTEYAERLAHHAWRGDVWDKALSYLRQAGRKAFARAAHREAVVHFEQALVALTHLPDSHDSRELAVDLRFDLRNSLFTLGEHGRVLHYLKEAETVAASLDDQRRQGQVYSYLTNCYLTMGDQESAIDSGQRALTLASALEDFNLQVTTNFYLGQVYASLGDYRHAIDCNSRNVKFLEETPGRERFDQAALLGLSRTWLVWCQAELGEFADGIATGDEGARAAEAADQPFGRILASLGLGLVYLRKGDLDKAIPVLERGLQLCQIGDLVIWFPAIASPLGYAYALSGRVGEAVPLLERAVEETTSLRRVGHTLRVGHLSEAYLLAGRMDDAIHLAFHGLDLSRTHKERGHQAYALRLLGEIYSSWNPPDAEKAQDHYRQALALAEELGMRPLLAHCHFGLGRVYGRTGNSQQGQAHLATATTMFREMDMGFWLERAQAG